MDRTHARRASALRGSTASHPGSTPPRTAAGPIAVLSDYRRADLPIAETSLSIGLRFRLSLLGVGLGLGACAICAVLGLLIVGSVFHTSLGEIA